MLVLISGFGFLISEPRDLFCYVERDQLMSFFSVRQNFHCPFVDIKFFSNLFSYRSLLLFFLPSIGSMNNSFRLQMSILPDKSMNNISGVIKTTASVTVKSLSFVCRWASSWKVFTFCTYSLNVVYSGKDTKIFLK